MDHMVIYDSFFGNTEQIAQAIGAALGPAEAVAILRPGEVQPEHWTGLKLLVVGSPTRAFRATPAMTALLKKIPRDALAGVKVAAFDTRIDPGDVNSRALRFLMQRCGYAAKPLANRLVKKGGQLAAPPEGFCVQDTKGPLKAGELERATEWAKAIAAAS